MISHILTATDFSEHAYAAVKAAIELAEDLDARVTILHTYDVPSSTGMLVSIEHIIHKDAQKDMEKLVARLNSEKLNMRLVKTKLIKDDVAVGVTKYSTRHNVDLIVIGNKGETGLNTIFFGSNAQNLVHNARIPVLVIVSEDPFQQNRDMLFAFEKEDHLKKVPTFPLVQIAGNFNSTIHMLRVIKPGEEAEKINIPDSFKGLSTKVVDVYGTDVIEEVGKYSEERDIQITCLIYKKRSWLESLFYGSTINMKQFATEKMNVLILREK